VTRNLLVVLLNDALLSELRSAVAERGDGLPNVYVVAPTHVGPLHWLATDEQAARSEAGVRAAARSVVATRVLSPSGGSATRVVL
jgi:hypothetical protein